jgi:hypothetical protein
VHKVDQLAEGLDTAVAKGDSLHGKAEDAVDKFSGVLDVSRKHADPRLRWTSAAFWLLA